MCQHSEAQRLRRPAVPENLRPEFDHVESFDVPASWVDDPALRKGARVFLGLSSSPLAERILFVGEAARAWRGGIALAVLGVRVAILRDGVVIGTARNPNADELAAAIQGAIVNEEILDELRESRTVAETMLDFDEPREAAYVGENEGPEYVAALEEARRMLLAGVTRRSGRVLLRLVSRELRRLEKREYVPLGTFGADGVFVPLPGFRSEQRDGFLAVWQEEVLAPLIASAPDLGQLQPARFPGDLCPDCGERAEECRCIYGATGIVGEALPESPL